LAITAKLWWARFASLCPPYAAEGVPVSSRGLPRLRAAGRARAHVGEQRRLRTHHLGERTVGANFVAPLRQLRRRAADPDRADELVTVDGDRQRARIGEIAERYLARFRRAPGQHLIHRRLARLARVERRARLHERGLDVDLALAVHAVEVDRLTELIEDDDADPHAALDGLLDAGLADRLRGRDVDLILLHHHLRCLAADEEFVAVVRARGARQH